MENTEMATARCARRVGAPVMLFALLGGLGLLLRPFVGGASASTGRYEISLDTVFDNVTKLTWQRAPSTERVTWQGARDYCQKLPVAGGSWRLPTLPELLSLVDRSALDPAIATTAFPGTPSDAFWTSTPFVRGSGSAWNVDFDHGGSDDDVVGSAYYVRCVR